ncbi:MAG: hypothetical protein QOD75_3507 [Blastocatellia bacterium]|nr:hypothetical protein [Blastocatellia bacterium]
MAPGRMRQRFELRQAKKAARFLDGVTQAKDVIEDLGVVGILLEPHQLVVDGIERFVGPSKTRAADHPWTRPQRTGARHRRAFYEFGQFRSKGFKFGSAMGNERGEERGHGGGGKELVNHVHVR